MWAEKENMSQLSQQSNDDDGLTIFMDDVFSQKIIDEGSRLIPILSQSDCNMDFSNVATQQVEPIHQENYINFSNVATQRSEYGFEFSDVATQKDTVMTYTNYTNCNTQEGYNATNNQYDDIHNENFEENDEPIPTQESDPCTIWLLKAAKDYIHGSVNENDKSKGELKKEIEETLIKLNWKRALPNWVEISHDEKEWWHNLSVYYGPWTEWINPWNLILGIDYFWEFSDVMSYVAQNGNKRVKDSGISLLVNYSNAEKWDIIKFFRENIKSQVISTTECYPLDHTEVENLMLEYGWKRITIIGDSFYTKPESSPITAANIHKLIVDVDYFRDLSAAYTYFRRTFTTIEEDFVDAVAALASNCSKRSDWRNAFAYLKKILRKQQWLSQETDDSNGTVWIRPAATHIEPCRLVSGSDYYSEKDMTIKYLRISNSSLPISTSNGDTRPNEHEPITSKNYDISGDTGTVDMIDNTNAEESIKRNLLNGNTTFKSLIEPLKTLGWSNFYISGDPFHTDAWIASWAPKSAMVSDKRYNAKLMVKGRDYFIHTDDVIKYLKRYGHVKVDDVSDIDDVPEKRQRKAPAHMDSDMEVSHIVKKVKNIENANEIMDIVSTSDESDPAAIIVSLVKRNIHVLRGATLFSLLKEPLLTLGWKNVWLVHGAGETAWVAPWAPEIARRSNKFDAECMTQNRDYFLENTDLIRYLYKYGPSQTSAPPTILKTNISRTKQSTLDESTKELDRVRIIPKVGNIKSKLHIVVSDSDRTDSDDDDDSIVDVDSLSPLDQISHWLKYDTVSFKSLIEPLRTLGWSNLYISGDPFHTDAWIASWAPKSAMVSDKRYNAKLMVKGRDYFIHTDDIIKYLKRYGHVKVDDVSDIDDVPEKRQRKAPVLKAAAPKDLVTEAVSSVKRRKSVESKAVVLSEVESDDDNEESMIDVDSLSPLDQISHWLKYDTVSFKSLSEPLKTLGWSNFYISGDPFYGDAWIASWAPKSAMVSDKRYNAKLMVKGRDYFIHTDDIIKYLRQHGLNELKNNSPKFTDITPRHEFDSSNDNGVESTFKISSKTHGRLSLPVRTVEEIDEDITRLVTKSEIGGSVVHCDISAPINQDVIVSDNVDVSELVSRINDLKALSRALLVSLAINTYIESRTEYTIAEMQTVCNEYSRRLGMNAKTVDELKYYVEDLLENELLREIVTDEKYLLQIDLNSILFNCDRLEDVHREAMSDYFNLTQS